MLNKDPLNRFPRHAIAVAVSAVCASAQAAEEAIIEEVLVTATKRTESLQDVALSIQVLTDADIVKQGFKQLDDYIGQLPSLSFGRREPGGTNVIMRGCAVSGIAFSDNPTSAVYLDEQPITVAGFNPDPRLIDINRVEALSGPQGTLFGDASQCGTLRIITNKPDTQEFDAWVDVTTSTIKDGDVGYDLSAMVNVPLIQDKLALRIVGFIGEEAGYIDNVLGTSPGGQFNNAQWTKDNINESTTSGGRIGLRWQPNEDVTVDLVTIYQNVDQDGFGDNDLGSGFFAGQSIGEWEQFRFNDDSWDDEWYQVALTVEANLGFADLTVMGSFMNRKTRYEADSTAYLFAWQEINTYFNTFGTGYTIYDFGGDPHALSTDDSDVDRTTFEARLTTPSDSPSRWSGLLGIFYNKAENETVFRANVEGLGDTYAGAYLSYLHYYYFGTFPATNDNWWHGAYEDTLEQTAVFGEVTFDITENFSITAGGRWFNIETDRELQNGNYIANPKELNLNCGDIDAWQIGGIAQVGVNTCYTNEIAKSDESDFVPKLNFTYRFNDDKMVYATYSEGFRRGGANAAKPASIFGAGGQFHEFGSDLLKNYEVGAKTTWADGRFQLNISAYHMVWEDIQVEGEDPTPGLFTLGIVNFPEAEIDGFEADLVWIPAPRWDVRATLGYNDAELSKTAILFPNAVEPKVALKGTRLPISPEWKGSLSVEYHFEREVFGAKPFARFDFQFQDESVNSLEGIQSIEFDNPVRKQGSYNLLDLRVGLEADAWGASLFINNVTDEYAEQFFNDRWAQTRLSVNRPRTIGVNFRRYFTR